MTSDNLLHVVMNGHVVGDIQRTGRKRMRLRYEEEAAGTTPLSVSMPRTLGRYRENVLVPWLDGLLPDRPEMVRLWRRQFGITNDDSVFALLRHEGQPSGRASRQLRRHL